MLKQFLASKQRRLNFSRSLMTVPALENISVFFPYYIDQRFLSSFILWPTVKLKQIADQVQVLKILATD